MFGCIEWDWMASTLDYQLYNPTSMYEQHCINLFDPLELNDLD